MRLCAATTWGYGSDGRAMRSQRIGHGFESRYLHQQRRLRQGRKRKEVATTAASFLLLRMLHRLLVPLSGERNNVALRCTTLTLRLRLGTNPVISTTFLVWQYVRPFFVAHASLRLLGRDLLRKYAGCRRYRSSRATHRSRVRIPSLPPSERHGNSRAFFNATAKG